MSLSLNFIHTRCETSVSQSVCVATLTVKTFARLFRESFHSERTCMYLGVIVCRALHSDDVYNCTMCVYTYSYVYSEWYIAPHKYFSKYNNYTP